MPGIDREAIGQTLSAIGGTERPPDMEGGPSGYRDGGRSRLSGSLASEIRECLDDALYGLRSEKYAGGPYWQFVADVVRMCVYHEARAMKYESIAGKDWPGLSAIAENCRNTAAQLSCVAQVLDPNPGDEATFEALRGTPLPSAEPPFPLALPRPKLAPDRF